MAPRNPRDAAHCAFAHGNISGTCGDEEVVGRTAVQLEPGTAEHGNGMAQTAGGYTFFATGIVKLVHRYDKCLNQHDNCGEKKIIDVAPHWMETFVHIPIFVFLA